MSRDEQSCLIVSYRELKQCIDSTFRELVKRSSKHFHQYSFQLKMFSLGPFFNTFACLSGLLKKKRFRLTDTQKYRQRKRLQAVDSLLDVLKESGVKLRALDEARLAPRESEMTAFEKYWIPSKRYRDGFKPVSWAPHWTKTPHPRRWKPTATHEDHSPKKAEIF
jgi:hypothetical protein